MNAPTRANCSNAEETGQTTSGMLHQIGAKFAAANGGDIVHGNGAALKELWSLTYREARVQTLADAFIAMAVCLAIATLMVPLLRKITTPAAPSTDAH